MTGLGMKVGVTHREVLGSEAVLLRLENRLGRVHARLRLGLEREHETQAPPRKLIQRDDPKFASAKMASFQYLAVAVFLFLVSGFWQLQIQSPEVYNERAERNRARCARPWAQARAGPRGRQRPRSHGPGRTAGPRPNP